MEFENFKIFDSVKIFTNTSIESMGFTLTNQIINKAVNSVEKHINFGKQIFSDKDINNIKRDPNYFKKGKTNYQEMKYYENINESFEKNDGVYGCQDVFILYKYFELQSNMINSNK